MENGQAKVHHHSRGKATTEDTAAPKTEGHRVSTVASEVVVAAATTDEATNTDPLHPLPQENDVQIGAAETAATTTSPHPQQTAATRSLPSPATAPMAQTAAEVMFPPATPTSPATAQTDTVAPANQTTVHAAAPATLAIPVRVTPTTALIGAARIVIVTATIEAAIEETLCRRGGMRVRGRGVPSAEMRMEVAMEGGGMSRIFIGGDEDANADQRFGLVFFFFFFPLYILCSWPNLVPFVEFGLPTPKWMRDLHGLHFEV